MTIFPRHRRAAMSVAALAVGTSLSPCLIDSAAAQGKSVEVSAYRQLGASEMMASPGQNGGDYSANAPSLAGLTLLATISAPAASRLGYLIQAQCTEGLTVALDDAAGALAPTLVVLQGAGSNGDQGGSLNMAGMPHTGRIRIYSSSASCQMAARAW